MLEKLVRILEIVRLVSLIIAIWLGMTFGTMMIKAKSDCIQFNAPQATISLRDGAVCTISYMGTQISKPLSELRSGE